MSASLQSNERTNVDKAIAAWGESCPDWIIALAQACDNTSQNKVGQRLGYRSGAVVCAVIGNNYNKGDMAMVENRVRGELMSATVQCPANGDISLAVCLDNQTHAKNQNRTSAFRARMVLACRKCPISSIGG